MSVKPLTISELRELSDVELVDDARKGTPESFEEIVRRYERPITGYLYRMLRDYDHSLDVSQEVFIKVYNSLEKYRSEYKFSTWIYRIAHNAAIDHMRRNSVNTQSIETETVDGAYQLQIESPLPSPEQERERSEWRMEIEAVVNRLPATYKDLVILRHSQDLSYDEIAEITGFPLGTVKNRLFRAREMMRAMLIEKGFTNF